MNDLGTINILVDVQGKPLIKQLTTDLNEVVVAEAKVSKATQELIGNLKEISRIKALASKSVDGLASSFRRLSGAELQQVSQRLAGLDPLLSNTQRGMNSFGVAAQQTGYQVSDFIVQIQGGTNPLVAFSQQATQLAGLLYLLPQRLQDARLGVGIFSVSLTTAVAGITILIPLLSMLAMSFFNSSKDVVKAEDGVNNFVSALKDAEGYLETSAASVDDLREKYGSFAEEMKDLSRFLSEVAVSRAFDSLNTESSLFLTNISDTADNILRLQGDINSIDLSKFEVGSSNLQIAKENISGMQEGVVDLAGSLGMTVEQVLALNSAFDNVQSQTTMEGVAKAAFEALKMVEGMNFATGQMPPELAKAVEQLEKVLSAASRFSKVDMESGIAAAASTARELANQLGISLGLATRIQSMGGSVIYDPRDPNYDPVAAEMMKLRENAGTVSPFDPSRQDTGGAAGGGGGAGTTTLENKMEEIYKYLELDKYLVEQETIAFEQRQEVLRSALENKMLTLQEYNELEKALALQHQQDLAEIENQGQMHKLSTVLGAGAQILEAVGKHNEKAAKMARIFGAAQALADTYAGAAAALKLPFPANLAAAASIISAGLGFVGAIRSGSTTGVKGAGGVRTRESATVAQSTAPATPQTVLISGLDPNALFTGEQLSRLFENFYKENDNRGKVFVVAR